MIQRICVGIIAGVVLAGKSSAFSSRPPSASRHPSALSAAEDDEVDRLLAQARQLKEEARRRREEVAAMTGRTPEDMEREAQREKRQRRAIEEKARSERAEAESSDRDRGARGGGSGTRAAILPVPDDAAAQVRQAAAAVERAFRDGVVRQTVRFALLEEDEAMSGEVNEWPGGVEQMYRRAGRPLTEALLREARAYARAGGGSDDDAAPSSAPSLAPPPEVTAKDIWDFDGSAVISARAAGGSHGDVAAVVFPNTDTKYLDVIDALATDVGGDRLLLLVNPFWKNADSWGFNILAPNGKRRAQEVIFDNGYDVTYAVLRPSVRGEDCVVLKAYPYDWQIYAYREDPAWFNQERPVWLGSSEEEPGSAQIAALLNDRPEFRMSKNMRQMQRMLGNDDM